MTSATVPAAGRVRPFRWSRKKYYRMGELGFFDGCRVELIEGRIYRMPRQPELEVRALGDVRGALNNAFGDGYYLRSKSPLDLGEWSDPEPDLAIVPGRPGDYKDTPRSALIVVEVSLATLAHDRGRKLSLYAKAGILDYWVINLVDNRLEIYRTPRRDPATAFGFGYAAPVIPGRGDVVAPLAKPDATVRVADLLP